MEHPCLPNPIDVICPECQSAPGADCTYKVRDGRKNCKPHDARWDAAEPIFILRAQDQSASALIQMWISLNHKAPKKKIESAQKILEQFRAWPKKKSPD